MKCAGGIEFVGEPLEQFHCLGRGDDYHRVGVLVQCDRDLGQHFPEGTPSGQLPEHFHKRLGRYVLETEDSHIRLAAARFVATVLIVPPLALLPLALFLFGALPFAIVFFTLPAFPFCVFSFAIAFFVFPALQIAAVPVGHVGHAAAFGAPIRSLAVALSFALGPCACRQDQNDYHHYPFCACPIHDIVLSVGGVLYVECILPDSTVSTQTFPPSAPAAGGGGQGQNTSLAPRVTSRHQAMCPGR